MSYMKNDSKFLGLGTPNFRAPEILKGICKNPKVADIYSAGIILFALLVKSLAFIEDVLVEGYNMYDLVAK